MVLRCLGLLELARYSESAVNWPTLNSQRPPLKVLPRRNYELFTKRTQRILRIARLGLLPRINPALGYLRSHFSAFPAKFPSNHCSSDKAAPLWKCGGGSTNNVMPNPLTNGNPNRRYIITATFTNTSTPTRTYYSGSREYVPSSAIVGYASPPTVNNALPAPILNHPVLLRIIQTIHFRKFVDLQSRCQFVFRLKDPLEPVYSSQSEFFFFRCAAAPRVFIIDCPSVRQGYAECAE